MQLGSPSNAASLSSLSFVFHRHVFYFVHMRVPAPNAPRRRSRWKVLGFSALACLLAAIVGLAVIPAISPSTGAYIADLLRQVVGVQAVSNLESVSDRLRDDINRLRSSIDPGQPQISWSTSGFANLPMQPPAPATTPDSSSNAKPGPLAPSPNVVTADPQIGWQPYGASADGSPLMAKAMVMVDPQRSYAGVALVRMDLSRLDLHMMPGTIEPAHPSGIGKVIPDVGMIPPADRAALIAAFNGGFKAVHGHFGMAVDGLTLLPPVNGMATVAVYQDGSVRMGAWNQDLLPSADMVAMRQNCPPLIDAGQLNPALGKNANKAWGFTNNADVTWRTALGLSQDGRYLIYAVGNGTDAKFLAEALQQAGAYWAMQLDINQYYAHFDAYSQVNGQPVGEALVAQMSNEPTLFMSPHVRDFFYLTLR